MLIQHTIQAKSFHLIFIQNLAFVSSCLIYTKKRVGFHLLEKTYSCFFYCSKLKFRFNVYYFLYFKHKNPVTCHLLKKSFD